MKLEDINNIANTFYQLKEKAKIGTKEDIREYKKYQSFCVSTLACLVSAKTGRYKSFPNYSDLCQDGFEALLMALESYNPEKGCFAWWANKYISTKLYRSANAHTAIKIPIKFAKETPPYKTEMPFLVDSSDNSSELLEKNQTARFLKEAIVNLPKIKREIVIRHYDEYGFSQPIRQISNELNISTQKCNKLLSEAESFISNFVKEKFEIYSHSRQRG